MPITASAKKAVRQSKKRALRNVKKNDTMKDAVKKYRKLVEAKKLDEARALLASLYQVIDKTAKANVIKKNKASRMKSRLSKLVKEAIK
jgi:small subunit ribosomal protein S20